MAQVEDRRWKRDASGRKVRTSYDGPSPWRARWRDPDGVQKAKSFARKVDAEQYLTSVGHRMLLGEYVDPDAGRITVREWLEDWRQRQVHRQSTQDQIERYFRLHVYPTLGTRELRSLRPSDVQALVTERSQTLAPASVALIYGHLSAALKDAVRDRVLSRSPADGIKVPRKVHAEVSPPTVAQVETIADAIDARYRAAVVVAAGAGLRVGEVLGLHVDRIDFLRRTIRVDQQLVGDARGSATVLGQPKTASSVRTVPMADVVATELAAHMRRFPPVDGFVFTAPSGLPVPRSSLQGAWARATKAAGYTGVRFHDLRHFYASALIQAGCSVKAVQAALGHATATETLNVYSHLWPDDEDRTRAAIQAVFTAPADAGCVPDVYREMSNPV